MQSALLSFTPSLSKALIAKGVAALPEVRRAFEQGRIFISTGTATSHIFSELTGKPPGQTLACGMITTKGTCVGRAMIDFLGSRGHARFWFLEKGIPVETEDIDKALESLSPEDVFIKGANALDPHGVAGVLLGMESGGIIGKAIGHVMARGVNFIIPVGLEKTVSDGIQVVAAQMGVQRLTYSAGMPVGMLPLSGRVVTEKEALRALFEVEVFHAASGGVAGAEGSVTILARGADEQIENVVDFYLKLLESKDENMMEAIPSLCHEHKWPHCVRKNILYKRNVKNRQ